MRVANSKGGLACLSHPSSAASADSALATKPGEKCRLAETQGKRLVLRAASLLLLFALVALGRSSALAFDCYAAADGGDRLVAVDETNANETLLGQMAGAPDVEAIALDPATGVLYGADADRLGTLNTTTGAFSPKASAFGSGAGSFGSISFNDVDGLAFSAQTGLLYGSVRRSGADLLIRINPATGAHVANAFGSGVDYVPIDVPGFDDVDDLAFDPLDGQLYAVANTNNGANAILVRVDAASGSTITVGPLLTAGAVQVNDMEGLGTAPNGQLYGTTGVSAGGNSNSLWTIDKTSATVTLVGALSAGTDYEGVDCNSQPPATPTATATNTAPATNTPTDTPTNTPNPTDTPTDTPTNTPNPTDTPTDTPTRRIRRTRPTRRRIRRRTRRTRPTRRRIRRRRYAEPDQHADAHAEPDQHADRYAEPDRHAAPDIVRQRCRRWR